MKKSLVPLFIALSAVAFVFATTAPAAQGKSMTPQQEKFANCAHESKGIKGEEHKKFMSDCLKGKAHDVQSEMATSSAAAGSMKTEAHKTRAKARKTEEKTESAATSQRAKMKTCNAQAKEKKLKSTARREFMSSCLKG